VTSVKDADSLNESTDQDFYRLPSQGDTRKRLAPSLNDFEKFASCLTSC
jgi:hypothetical protein